MEKLTDKRVMLGIAIGGFVLVIIIVILVSLSSNKKKAKDTESISNISSSQDMPVATNIDKHKPAPVLTQKAKTANDYFQITSKVLEHIETQKNGSFYNLSNNQKDVSYHANSYLASAYFDLFQKGRGTKYLALATSLSDSLMNHCLAKKDYAKDCYYILEPYFKLNASGNPRYLAFIKNSLSRSENLTTDSLNAYVNLSKQYLSYYQISLKDLDYQKAQGAYQKALNLLPESQGDIGLLIQNQYVFYQVTNDSAWLKTGENYFNQFNDGLYKKMRTTQKLFFLEALKNFPAYRDLYERLLSEFIYTNYNKDRGFVCYKSNDCKENSMSLIIDNALFIRLINP